MTRTLLLLVLLAGCARERLMTRYLAQAAYGQAELLSKARPIDEVIRDPQTPVRTAALLASIDEIKAYGRIRCRAAPTLQSFLAGATAATSPWFFQHKGGAT